jgi:opacity protein-like surface antigen
MPAAQGWLGIGNLEQRNLDIDPSQGHVDDVDEATLPVIGGAFMQPLGGNERFSYGLEGGLSFGWDGDIEAVVVGSGGIAVAGSTDVFLGDLFGGPYIAFDLTPKVRIYGSTGLGLQWASFDLGFEDTAFGHQHVSGDAFGGEWYVRTGIEFRISPATWIGLGLRYVDSSVDPSGSIGDVDLRQEQLLFTVTNGF